MRAYVARSRTIRDRRQQSNANQHSSLRSRWSSSTRSRISRVSCARCQRHSRRPASSRSPSTAAVRAALTVYAAAPSSWAATWPTAAGLAGRVGGMACRPAQVPGRGVGVAGRRACLCPRDLTTRPGTPQLDRASRPAVIRPRLLEVVQHVLRAVGRPGREQAVLPVIEAATTAHGDEPGIANLGKDHGCGRPRVLPPAMAMSAVRLTAGPPAGQQRMADGMSRFRVGGPRQLSRFAVERHRIGQEKQRAT